MFIFLICKFWQLKKLQTLFLRVINISYICFLDVSSLIQELEILIRKLFIILWRIAKPLPSPTQWKIVKLYHHLCLKCLSVIFEGCLSYESVSSEYNACQLLGIGLNKWRWCFRLLWIWRACAADMSTYAQVYSGFVHTCCNQYIVANIRLVIVIVIVYLFHRSLWLNSTTGCRTCQKI
jgi:hypothetical protein